MVAPFRRPPSLERTAIGDPQPARGDLRAPRPILANHLRRRPEALLRRRGGPGPRHGRATLEANSRRASPRTPRPDDDAAAFAAHLRLVKYDELVRITVREADASLVPIDEASAEPLAELSHLAEALLDAALASAARALEASTW